MDVADNNLVRTEGPLSPEESDQIPIVILSRWRLAERVFRNYGMEVVLVVDEVETPGSYRYYTLLVRGQNDFSVPLICKNPRRFHDGMSHLHALLDMFSPLGKTLGELMVEGEASVSVALSHSGPDGGR